MPSQHVEQLRSAEARQAGADIADAEDAQRRPLPILGEPSGSVGNAHGKARTGQTETEAGQTELDIGIAPT